MMVFISSKQRRECAKSFIFEIWVGIILPFEISDFEIYVFTYSCNYRMYYFGSCFTVFINFYTIESHVELTLV